MELINRAEKYKIENFDEIAKKLIHSFQCVAPDSLDKIIVTPNEHQEYINIIREYSNNTSPTKDNLSVGVGITISQIH